MYHFELLLTFYIIKVIKLSKWHIKTQAVMLQLVKQTDIGYYNESNWFSF